MSYLNFSSRYDKWPETRIQGFDERAWQGFEAVAGELKRAMSHKRVLVVDCYPGVDDEALLPALRERLGVSHVLMSDEIFYNGDTLTQMMRRNLTDDRVRGMMYHGDIGDFVDPDRLCSMRNKLQMLDGTILIYGFGASLVDSGNILVYADMARWEIQLRYRAGMPNFKQSNEREEALGKFKRGYFVEWRIADRHKRSLFEHMHYYLDANAAGDPKMVTVQALLCALDALTKKPFRLVPYFDPGVWGGQWMKEVCGLDPTSPNYAWSFDGVPEENSLYLRYGQVRVETPAMNLVLYRPRQLLGEKTFSRFGAEFPIRFDFLDTIDGQNLSLQVHPDTEYIKTRFGMSYTQDESYYIMDAQPDGGVYLGVQTGIDPQAMIKELERAQQGGPEFDAERYINRFPAKKHDHFLIPAGTVHCSSKGCMVLEISATPYIFTFKLWDWNRVDLNGKPRPIHIEDGKNVICFDRDTQWVRQNLINRFQMIHDGVDYQEVRTGLHPYEFIETRVLSSAYEIPLPADGEFSMLNLVEGQAAVVESPEKRFSTYTVHYAETFIIPALAGDCVIRPEREGQIIKVLRASVRFG